MKKVPGKAVRGSSTGKPIMVLLDVLGQKWTLRILWELATATKNLTFRELRENTDNMSPTSLNNRLQELRHLQIVTLNENGYGLTTMGVELVAQLLPLHSWAESWAQVIESKNV